MPKNTCSCSCKNIRFFYNLKSNNTVISKQFFDSTLIETLNGNIYEDVNLTTSIGKIAIINTIYDINNSNNNNLFDVTAQVTLFLSDGNIQFITAFKVTKNNEGNYIFPTSKTKFKILSGTGKYLNAKGYITIKATLINFFRRGKITFTHC
jgi:hypothetical protein